MEEEWKNERPSWCRYPAECVHVIRSQNAICAGRLPEPVAHDGDVDTHRLCLKVNNKAKPFSSILWSRSDAYNLRRVRDAVAADCG